jgi:hypothetical protein
VWSIGTVTMPCLQRIVSIPISGLGIPVVPLASLVSDIIWVIHCHPSFYRCFYDLRQKSLSLDLVFAIVLPLVTDVFVIPTMSSLCGNLSRPKFDVDMEQSPLLVVLSSSSSLASPSSPYPPDRPGSRDEILCWW